MVEKVEGWEVALANVMTSRLKSPHVWGENDCVTFAADCVLAMTGTDLMKGIRGKYDGPKSAARLIARRGFKSLGDMIASYLPEIYPGLARRGDVVMCWSEDDEDFVAVLERHTAVSPGELGTVHVPLSQVTRAFKVGGVSWSQPQ